jgi:hypothetical protein
MKQLESLQETNPDKFKEVTATISQKLEDAAKAAAASGDPQQASALNDLAAKFKTASETGKMPHLHRGHGGAHALPPPDTESDSSSNPATTDLATLLAKYTQNSAVDPMATLSGIMSSVLD